MTLNQRGQVLAFFALALPLVLLPVAAYAVDSAAVSGRAAGLQAAAAQAAEVAAQQLDVPTIRSSGKLVLDGAMARFAASQTIAGEEPGAVLDQVSVSGAIVTILASERVDMPLPLLVRTVTLHAHAAARLVPGYGRPSSLLPLPNSTF